MSNDKLKFPIKVTRKVDLSYYAEREVVLTEEDFLENPDLKEALESENWDTFIDESEVDGASTEPVGEAQEKHLYTVIEDADDLELYRMDD